MNVPATNNDILIELQDELVVENIDYKNAYDFHVIHRHAYFEFILFDEGHSGKQIIDFVEYRIAPKSLYLILPGQVHLMRREPNENGILIQFSKSFMRQSFAQYQADHHFLFQSHPEIKLNDEQYCSLQVLFLKMKEVYQTNTAHRYHKLSYLLGYLLSEILEIIPIEKNGQSDDHLAYRFLHAVENHFKTIKTVSAYAHLLNTTVNNLTQKVKTHFGKTPLQIIHETILVEIKRLLIVEKQLHKEIAYALNFDSQGSYNRFVKRHTRLSPSALRHQLYQIAK